MLGVLQSTLHTWLLLPIIILWQRIIIFIAEEEPKSLERISTLSKVTGLVQADRALECRLLPTLLQGSVRWGGVVVGKGVKAGRYQGKEENQVLLRGFCVADHIISFPRWNHHLGMIASIPGFKEPLLIASPDCLYPRVQRIVQETVVRAAFGAGESTQTVFFNTPPA